MIDKVFAEGIDNPAIPSLIGKSGESIAGGIFSSVLGLLLIGAGLMTFTQLVLGGIQWITSGGEKGALESARNKIIHGIVGLILVASSWAIITLILGKFLGMDFPTIKIPTIGESVSGGGTNPGGGNPPAGTYLRSCPCSVDAAGPNKCAKNGDKSLLQGTCYQCTPTQWTVTTGCSGVLVQCGACP